MLFKLRQGEDPAQIKSQVDLALLTNRTNAYCRENGTSISGLSYREVSRDAMSSRSRETVSPIGQYTDKQVITVFSKTHKPVETVDDTHADIQPF